jgi:hypothetical protein
MVYQGIPLVNLTHCEIRFVLFGPDGRVKEWNLTIGLRLKPNIKDVYILLSNS